MKEVYGDIWEIQKADPGSWIVIPTNIGWKRDGSNVMGRGIARQAAERDPTLATWLGGFYRDRAVSETSLGFASVGKNIFFPNKPLNKSAPWLSWKGRSTTGQIKWSMNILWLGHRGIHAHNNFPGNIYMPLVGCGNGGLSETDVLPLIDTTGMECRPGYACTHIFLVRYGKPAPFAPVCGEGKEEKEPKERKPSGRAQSLGELLGI